MALLRNDPVLHSALSSIQLIAVKHCAQDDMYNAIRNGADILKRPTKAFRGGVTWNLYAEEDAEMTSPKTDS